jgi:SAM-dependent methyltransferase
MTALTKSKISRQYGKITLGDGSSDGIAERKKLGLIDLGYSRSELDWLPKQTLERAFSCGNPLAYVTVRDGTTIMDLGSGAGLDCLILARRLNGRNRLVGLDLTPGMAAAATSCARASGLGNVCFGVGDAEEIPMPDGSTDVVISNGVICLTVDKERVFREIFRILQPGGFLSISDLVYSMSPVMRVLGRYLSRIDTSVSLDGYRDSISKAGFEQIRVRARRRCRIEQVRRLWGARPLLARLSRLGCRPWLRPAADRLLEGISCIQLTAVKPTTARAEPA